MSFSGIDIQSKKLVINLHLSGMTQGHKLLLKVISTQDVLLSLQAIIQLPIKLKKLCGTRHHQLTNLYGKLEIKRQVK